MFDDDKSFNDKPIDFKKYLFRILNYWYFPLLFLILSIGVAYYVFMSTPEQYMVSAHLLIKGNQEQAPTIGSTSETALPGINLGTINNIENQLIILKSSKQLEKVLQQLDFGISYFKEEQFKAIEIYNESPFVVKLDTIGVALSNVKINIEFATGGLFKLNFEEEEEISQHKLYEKITNNGISFSVLPREGQRIENAYNQLYSFRVNPINNLILNYQNSVWVSEVKAGSSIFEISIQENNIQKGLDFINKLAENSVSYTLDKKNQVANNTIQFIENQLVDVSDSLNITKNMLENFRTRNEMMDISMQGQMIIDKTEALELEKNIVSRQLDYYNYLVNFLENGENIMNLLPPSGQGVENVIMDQLVAELSAMNAERQSLQFNSKEGNPAIARVNRQIEGHKQNILQQARSNVVSSQNDLDDVNSRLMQLGYQIRRLPKKEQVSLEIEQKFQTTDRMYNYLLERRSEAQLAKASNVPDNEIIEYARVTRQTKPNVKNLVVIVIVIGLILPSIIIFLIIFLNSKVQDKDDLEDIARIPILGVIPQAGSKKMVQNYLTKPIYAESIRNIRTAIEFYPNKVNSRCILVSSGLPGEGKSSTAVSLAISYAQLRKKVVIVDYDMRKPMVRKLLDIKENGYGLSSFLSQFNSQDMHKLIHSNDDYSLDIIPTGEIPPNPAELIAGDQTKMLIQELRKLYDVIIIDSPPIGLVTDAQILSRMADINILVT
ncbi:MAG: polysaccharide biosynthesis tyrosine autokinase, partial [Carboxylicivirga sp.]|nr:polysaccharide biosynthesis tyrosine autokinase [Carboxylicivirga sp.]